MLLLLATACGGSTVASSGSPGPGGAGGSGAGGSDAGVEGSAGHAGSGGGFSIDAGDAYAPPNPWADSGPIDAGVFDCNGACCDGTTHYCQITSGGAAPVFGTPPEAGLTCGDAGTNNWCVPLPSACVGAPSCGCIVAPYAGCQCAPTGGGITVTCIFP